METEEFEDDEDEDAPALPRQRESLPPLPISELTRMRAETDLSLMRIAGIGLPQWPLQPHGASVRSLVPELGIEIPVGPLFYPCCGDDTDDALALFGSHVTECHFSDPFSAPWMGRRGRSDPEAPRVVEVPFIGNVVIGDHNTRQSMRGNARVVSHRADGVLTLLKAVGPLSVFYYRGDSGGEGGSGQLWSRPVLFDVVMSLVMDGGLICSDGSNGGGLHVGERLSEEAVTSLPFDGRVGQVFEYRGRVLRCIALLPGGRHAPFSVWQTS